MKKRAPLFASMALLLGLTTGVHAQVSVGVGINLPGVSIGIDMPAFPQLVAVPGYPVYYDPNVEANYFFYDGLYWVYRDDNWYQSTWYNGPWLVQRPEYVPLYVLRVPVRYYRQPPLYFRGWRADAPPRWGVHWGPSWEVKHRGWDHWDHRAVPRPAPLPVYQRNYAGDRYPKAIEQQHEIRVQNYRYEPRDTVTQQVFQRRDAAVDSRSPGTTERPQPTPLPRQHPPVASPRPAPIASPQRPGQADPRPGQAEPRPALVDHRPPPTQGQPRPTPPQSPSAQQRPQVDPPQRPGREAPNPGADRRPDNRPDNRQDNRQDNRDR